MPDHVHAAAERLLQMINEYGGERPGRQHAMWAEVETLTYALANAGRREGAEDLADRAAQCRDCGKAHVWRDLSSGDVLRGSWADPGDGHAYRTWLSLRHVDWLRALASTEGGPGA